MTRVVIMMAWLVAVAVPAEATPIINIDGEAYTVGNTLPDPNPWCTVSCGAASGDRGVSEAVANCDAPAGSPSLGTKCLKWNILANQTSHYSEVQCSASKCSTPISEGDTLFLAYQFNYTNGGGDVWHDGAGANSGDKGPGLHSPGLSGGFRWDNSMGCWDNNTECQDHKFTMWVGNPGYHWNIGGCGELNDIYRPNVAPYTGGVVPQLDYNRWHNGVMKITMSSGSSGRVEAWVDGAKYLDCPSIKTMEVADNNFSYIEFGGTIAQPAYDTPTHTRYFDNLVVTKTQADITDFFTDPETGGGGGGGSVSGDSRGGMPFGKRVILVEQVLAYVVAVGQWAVICGYLWERRAKAMQLLVAMHVWYWAVRYRLALRRWQRHAPRMLDAPRDTLDMRKGTHADHYDYR